MATKEVDLLGEAIAGTEAEIFGEAVNGAEVEAGEGEEPDRSLEAMDEVEEADSEAEGDGDGEFEDGEGEKPETKPNRDDEGKFAAKADVSKDAKADGDGKQGDKPAERRGDPQVPLSAERQRRQNLETELEKERRERETERTSFKTEFAKLEGRLDQVLRTQQPPAPKAEEAKTDEPDMFVDPEGHKQWIKDQIKQGVTAVKQEFSDLRINASMADAHEKHGKTFETAFSAVSALDQSNPANSAVLRSIREAPNPGAKLMAWHREQETLREVGPDPVAYVNRKVEEALAEKMKDPEFRKTMLADMQAEARGGTNGNRPRNIIRNVPSLNGAAGRGDSQVDPRAFDNSEGGVFASAFED